MKVVNRTIQQKMLKMKRRGRFARFSGATTRLVQTRAVQYVVFDTETSSHVEEKRVPVGNVSLSKQVINTGRGPDPERMQEYYARVSKESYEEYLPEAMPLTEPMKEIAKRYAAIVKDTPRKNRLTLIQSDFYRLDIFSNGDECYFVEMDFVSEYIRRSRTYGKRRNAMTALNNNRITWAGSLKGEA